MKTMRKCIFKQTSKDTLKLLSELNQSHQYTFLIPTKFISPEAGQVGYLLNTCINHFHNNKKEYRTFFSNSGHEALQGAIKIARSQSRGRNEVILLGFDDGHQLHFDPFIKGVNEALIPGVHLAKTDDHIIDMLNRNIKICAIAITARSLTEFYKINSIFEQARKKNILIILNTTAYHDLGNCIKFFKQLPDIVVFDESLTENEIPFGCFSMTTQVHKPWSDGDNCLVHSSTYSGNILALRKVKKLLIKNMAFLQTDAEAIQILFNEGISNKERKELFSKYVNPGIVELYEATGLDLHPKYAHKSTLRTESSESIMDCVSGGGVSVRGHTTDDLIPSVIDKHSITNDYWQELCDALFKITPFKFAVPAVSGATAIDNAFSIALSTDPQKNKIVIFKDNYAGKTLLSLVGSEDETIRNTFSPLYKHVTYIDPWAKDATNQLAHELEHEQVALIWFEIMQGANGKELPDELLKCINENKERYQYFIGVDEILMGLHRTGSQFTYQNKINKPDIITLSKALSDGAFPFGMTLLSGDLYRTASSSKPELIQYLSGLYINQIGSHIALNCLTDLISPNFVDQLTKTSKIFTEGFNKLERKSPFISKINGKGMFYHICYSKHLKLLGNTGEDLFLLYMCHKCMHQAKVFMFFDRCVPALSMSESDALSVINNLEEVMTKNIMTTVLGFFGFMTKIFGFIGFMDFAIKEIWLSIKRSNK